VSHLIKELFEFSIDKDNNLILKINKYA